MPIQNSKEAQILAILDNADIEGLDINDALGRLNNNAGIFMRIIRSFIQNMPAMLSELTAPTAAGLPDYSIKVHGAKGSLYGIGAVLAGDAAKDLEMASKAGDIDAVLAGNDAFIAAVEALIAKLVLLKERVEALDSEQTDNKNAAAAPDKELLRALLAATRNYDIDEMQLIIDSLAAKSYAQENDDIRFIKEKFESFDYDKIEQRLTAMLV
jgi:HPt (histidine-containing phosphotransfer) domain-containing protein